MAWRKGNRLRLVPEPEARERTAEIYQEVKAALGVPQVSLLFQAYAAYPPFLDMHWTRLRPLAATCEFFALAERLRADAYTRMHNYFEVPDLGARLEALKIAADARQEVNQVVELFHYANPLLLLIASAQLQAFDAPVGQPGPGTAPAEHPVFAKAPLPASEEAGVTAVRKLHGDVKHTLERPLVGAAFRVLARWPDFLAVYWEALRAMLQSPMYPECMHGISETAWALTRELPGPFALTLDELVEAGMKDEDIASVVRVTEVFIEDLAVLLLQIEMAKIGLEGGTRKTPPRVKPPASSAPEVAA